MVEIRENHINSGINELEKTFQEYKSKLEHAEQEAQQIIDLAWKKAEAIITSQQSDTQKIADETRQRARLEADRMIQEAKNRVAEIEKEADNRAKKEARDRTRREIEKIITDARQTAEKEAAEITDRARKGSDEIIREVKETQQKKMLEEASAIVDDAEQKAKRINEDSMARLDETSKMIAEVSQKADDILGQFKTRLQAELADLTMKLDKNKGNLEMRTILVRNEVGPGNKKNDGNNHFNERRELVVLPPYTGTQVKKLAELLKQIPGIKIDGNAATEDNFSIFLNIVEPIPLNNMLLELSLVESSDVKGDVIKLKLKPSKNGN